MSNELTLFECTSTNHEYTKAAFIMYTTGGGGGGGGGVGGGGYFQRKGGVFWPRGGVVKKFCMMWENIKKACHFKKYPLLLPAVYSMNTA